MVACGLDFGTSNTTLGLPQPEGGAVLCDLEGGEKTLPSAIFFERDGSHRLGRAAIDAYVDGFDGRLMRSLKSVLGSSLIDERTQIGKQRASFRDVMALFIGGAKRRVEKALGRETTSVVHGRPVHFVDGRPDADRRAEDALRKIAHEIGFSEVHFQYEPIAAALDYEQQITREEIAFVADIGGGTSDFSIVRISPERRAAVERQQDILANDGIRIGGTDFDRVLSLRTVMPLLGHGSAMKREGLLVPSGYFYDLATWHLINRVYDSRVLAEVRQVRREAAQPELLDRLIKAIEERRGHALVGTVERAKIDLATMPRVEIPLGWIEPGFGVEVSREDLSEKTQDLAERIASRVGKCLGLAGLDANHIDALFLTGGSTRLAHVRSALVAALPGTKVIDGDTFGSVGLGLAIEAGRRFGPASAAMPAEAN